MVQGFSFNQTGLKKARPDLSVPATQHKEPARRWNSTGSTSTSKEGKKHKNHNSLSPEPRNLLFSLKKEKKKKK